MEDTNIILCPFFDDTLKGLFCIFDGHAGKNCSTSASSIFPKTLQSELIGTPSPVDMKDIFTKTYAKVDEDLKEFEYEGCTATTVFVWQVGTQRYLQAANVGDSTAFLKRADHVMWLSKDHKAIDDEERNRVKMMGVDLADGQTRVGGLAVSRALGDHFLKKERLGVISEPFISPAIALESTDTTFVLASDGLWDVMTGEEAMALIEGMDDAENMAKVLITTAMDRPKCIDNITIIVAIL